MLDEAVDLANDNARHEAGRDISACNFYSIPIVVVLAGFEG